MTTTKIVVRSKEETKLELVDGKYRYEDALAVANAVIKELEQHCVRIEIAGSIRRKKALVGDIEIVAIPKPYLTGATESGIASVVNRWVKIKGELEYGKTKYTQRVLPAGIKLDLFFATEDNWGLVLGVRTGSADFSHKVLACGWVRQGFKSVGGHLFRDGVKQEIREERDLFEIIGVIQMEPEKRNL